MSSFSANVDTSWAWIRGVVQQTLFGPLGSTRHQHHPPGSVSAAGLSNTNNVIGRTVGCCASDTGARCKESKLSHGRGTACVLGVYGAAAVLYSGSYTAGLCTPQ